MVTRKKLVAAILLLVLSLLILLPNMPISHLLPKDSFGIKGIFSGNDTPPSIPSMTTVEMQNDPNTTSTPKTQVSLPRPVGVSSSQKPKILFWTTFWGDQDLVWGYPKASFGDVYQKLNCSFQCEHTVDKGQWSVSDAIMFFPIDSYWPLPPGRLGHQKWIFYQQESPILGAVNDARLDDVFNWTMTYHRGSDIPIPYGRFLRRQSSIPMQPLPTQRHKMAAWMVGHCNTHNQREVLFDKLSRLINTTQYGKCNGNPCNQGGLECMQAFRMEHYFYLSWENSLCDDYITEKLWNALAAGIVPVVYGGADYKQLLPPHSFIDIFDFNNVAELANYLIYLSNNATAYQEYLRWSEDYTINLDVALSWCDLCEKLHLEREQPTLTTVKGVEFWSVNRHCTRKESDKNKLFSSS